MLSKLYLAWIGLALGVAGTAMAANAPETEAQQVLHLLDYVAVEYPTFVSDGRVSNQSEFEEQVEFSDQVARLIAALPPNSKQTFLVKSARDLHAAVVAKADAVFVVQHARALQSNLINAYDIRIAHSKAPDSARGESLYRSTCAGCHGNSGDGKGAQAGALNPAPTNFTDPARQSQRSPFTLYNTITLGVDGTAMRGFSNLSDQDRWALAFYVSGFVASDADRDQGAKLWHKGVVERLQFSSLDQLASMTPAKARASGESVYPVLAYLRAHPEALLTGGSGQPLDVALEKLDESIRLYAAGRREAAHQAALSVYLDGFELAEARLPSDMRSRVEQKMMGFRALIRNGAPLEEVQSAAFDLANEFRAARGVATEDTASPATNFAASFIIILREGLEAMLVVAAIAAFLIRSGRRDALSYVHLGWIAALAAGGITWLLSSTLYSLSGAQRETTEGVTALIASAVLLYAGYWLHSKSHATRWQSFIRGEVTGALSSGQLWGLALISFLAVYREAFETVLFMQALWIEAGTAGRSALIGGMSVGAAGLVAAAWLIARFSAKLPLGLFFTVSAFFLAALAVVFAGRGIAALQAAGKLPMDPISIPGVPVLGIYPNVQGLVLQVLLITLIATGFFYSRTASRRR